MSSPHTQASPDARPRRGIERFALVTTTTALAVFLLFLFIAAFALARRSDLGEERYIELFVDVLRHVRDFYVEEEEVGTRDLVEGALKGMIDSLDDPYSTYLTGEEMELLEETTSGQFGGIGVVIGETRRGIEVSRPIRGTPAFKAGILPGDLIVAVDGRSIVDLGLDEAVQLIRGEPLTEVGLTIRRNGNEWEATLMRAVIETNSVERAVIDRGMGYLQILSFTMNTLQQVRDALDYLRDADYQGLILDLRGNPGGLLDSVVEVADLFLEKGTTVVSTESRVLALNRTYRSLQEPVVSPDIPIVVLIDRYSASASEILTGALKDHQRALVVGETSYGKGSVQEILPKGEGGVKLTSSYYLTPSGANINEVGIAPDVVVEVEELTEEEKESYRELVQSSRIESFLDSNPRPDDARIRDFLRSLQAEGYSIREELIRQYIKDEINRRNYVYPIYDLEYDTVLRQAVSLMRELMAAEAAEN